MNDAAYVFTLTSTQFLALKAAIRVLMRAGITREVAIEILIDAHRKAYTTPTGNKNHLHRA